MSVKVKYSSAYKAKIARIKKIPKLTNDALYGITKQDALAIKKTFHDGIKNDLLGLEQLADSTIKRKTKKGYDKPNSPLYGAGDSEGDRSYANMLSLREVKNGYNLYPDPRKNHHSGKIKLKDLFMIHEYGATIRRKKKDGETSLIRIPPRPALKIAYRTWLVQRKKKEPVSAKEVRKAIQEYINEGKSQELLDWASWRTKEE